jgi:multiple antibiotic resistance protein
MPMVAGPSALATILVMSNGKDANMTGIFLALLIAWGITATTLLLSPYLYKLLRKKGLLALEKLMGMLLLIMAVQMLLNGFADYVRNFSDVLQ